MDEKFVLLLTVIALGVTSLVILFMLFGSWGIDIQRSKEYVESSIDNLLNQFSVNYDKCITGNRFIKQAEFMRALKNRKNEVLELDMIIIRLPLVIFVLSYFISFYLIINETEQYEVFLYVAGIFFVVYIIIMFLEKPILILMKFKSLLTRELRNMIN